MADANFEDLALQYVLADDEGAQQGIAQKAASAIQSSANSRAAVGQWVASINRWMSHSDGDQADDGEEADHDLISRAKALSFLAATLQLLPKDFLRADQVKLLISFFCSLFSSDHRAGISAAAKALRQLASMKFFQPTLGDDIIQSTAKLQEDFKLQTPATRLELYELYRSLLRDPAVASDLEYRHGNSCGFMVSLLELCRNERDPKNLLVWFDTLKTCLQNFSPNADVTAELFKAFSAYFPISVRTSATPSGITADDLKSTLRACFSSHHRIASHAVPYLIAKLDQGDAVTVAVKVDILQTLEACLLQYGHAKQSVVPYVDQIWGSLKYEVRHGEVTDIIDATLKVIAAATKRLDGDDLTTFIENSWKDLKEDLGSPSHTASAGRLLVAIAGAKPQSFAIVSPPAVAEVKDVSRRTMPTTHQRDLLAVMNSLLLVRSSLFAHSDFAQSAVDSPIRASLKDELFGDSLFEGFYTPLWQSVLQGKINTDQVVVMKKLMEGLSALLYQQVSTSAQPADGDQLCSASTCSRMFEWLAKPSILSPLENSVFIGSLTAEAPNEELSQAATDALENVASAYPVGFQQLLMQFLTTLQTTYESRKDDPELPSLVGRIATRLSLIGTRKVPKRGSVLQNALLLINTMLQALGWLLSSKAHPTYWTSFVDSIHVAIIQTHRSLASVDTQATSETGTLITKEWFSRFSNNFTVSAGEGVLGLNDQALISSIQAFEFKELGAYRHFLAYSLIVVQQLYRRSTNLATQDGRLEICLSNDFAVQQQNMIEQQDRYLYQVARLANTSLRALNIQEQKDLLLAQDVVVLFRADEEALSSGMSFVKIALSEAPGEGLEPRLGQISRGDKFRTAPLSMGIIQALYPGTLEQLYRTHFVKDLSTILLSRDTHCSAATRAALENILTIAANKLTVVPKTDTTSVWVSLQEPFSQAFGDIVARNTESEKEKSTSIQIFRSILHFLAGDIARFSSKAEANKLLTTICSTAPTVQTLGHELAQCFEILVSPKECLEAANHAVLKRLRGGWIYLQTVQPFLGGCFPGEQQDEAAALSRAVAVFGILKHLKVNDYTDDVEKVVRITVRSLGAFKSGADLESCLAVLLNILEKEPDALKEHIGPIIKNVLAVYGVARNASAVKLSTADPALSRRVKRESAFCRKLALEFFAKLPGVYDARYLLPHRQVLVRELSTACGDPVREIRHTALLARSAWEKLS